MKAFLFSLSIFAALSPALHAHADSMEKFSCDIFNSVPVVVSESNTTGTQLNFPANDQGLANVVITDDQVITGRAAQDTLLSETGDQPSSWQDFFSSPLGIPTIIITPENRYGLSLDQLESVNKLRRLSMTVNAEDGEPGGEWAVDLLYVDGKLLSMRGAWPCQKL